ncbi:MAG TPA: hypothetical protein VFQ45_05420 [Longimicrobium sp.]|nr:hypothetical protein [Longimicrobium sp.]
MRIPVIPRRAFLAGLLVLVGACCGFEPEQDVRFRLRNASPYELKDVAVGFPDEMVAYGTLAPGAVTEYRTVARAYRYAYVEATIDGQLVVQQPIDYVGEEYVEPGSYTFVITVADPADRHGLSTLLERD